MSQQKSHSSLHIDLDDNVSNPRIEEAAATFSDLVSTRYSRRAFVKGAIASAVASNFGAVTAQAMTSTPQASSAFLFPEIEHGFGENHEVASDHSTDILLRWGDPLFSDAPEFDPYQQTAEAQEKQFGFNNDFLSFIPLPVAPSAEQQERGLLCVNHEYPTTSMMFPDLPKPFWEGLSLEMIEVTQASVGNSIVEIVKEQGAWRAVIDSPFNRRISARSTPIEVSGPAAGHHRLKTKSDPTGRNVIGTFNNCAGGITPWGTYLTCEENIDDHFDGELEEDHPESTNHRRYGVPGRLWKWGEFDPRFNIGVEPNEPNRFGWVVEIDPMDPTSTPKKRTALGRLKHEGAENVLAPSGQLVVYMGDDERFDYLYKFVSEASVDLNNKEANRDLLDHGTLYVAKFEENGTLAWLALTQGVGPLTPANGFESQADVVIEARRAADLLEATPMDRPEDVVPNPHTGKVYVMLTNNTRRTEPGIANPRANNAFGHIVEIIEPEGDFASASSRWDILIQGGDPKNPDHQAKWHPETSENGWFASPDNGVVDPLGRLWVSTDQSDKSGLSGTSDGLWSMDTEDNARGLGKMFYRCPRGAELCGPTFTPNGENLFVAVQHPGVNDEDTSKTGFDSPTTRWPDFRQDMPPRPSVVVIQKKGGGVIG